MHDTCQLKLVIFTTASRKQYLYPQERRQQEYGITVSATCRIMGIRWCVLSLTKDVLTHRYQYRSALRSD
jgi:hypothetical protein